MTSPWKNGPEPGRGGRLRAGLIQGGRGGPEDELLEDGQEEVFSRTEVEAGGIEHNCQAGGGAPSRHGADDVGDGPEAGQTPPKA